MLTVVWLVVWMVVVMDVPWVAEMVVTLVVRRGNVLVVWWVAWLATWWVFPTVVKRASDSVALMGDAKVSRSVGSWATSARKPTCGHKVSNSRYCF